MFEVFFRRNNFDLLYQALRWQDAVAAAFEKRLSRNADSIFDQLIRKKLALGDERFFHFESARQALASIFQNVTSDRKEVLVASFTCEVVPAYIIKSGLKPVFYPCSPLKRIDYDDVLNRINANTLAVVVQHSFGIKEDIRDLVSICKARGIIVIEDKALCFASGGAGSSELQGDFAFYSFEASKTVSCRMGGLLVFNRNSECRVNLQQPKEMPWWRQKVSDLRTFVAVVLYANDQRVCLYLRRLCVLTGILGRSINREDVDSRPVGPAYQLTRYQKKLIILQLIRISRLRATAAKNVRFWRKTLGSLIGAEYMSSECFPVRLPIKICGAKDLRSQLRLNGMLDQHWFTAGVGVDGFDGLKVGFDPEGFRENLKEAGDLVNLPTIKDLPRRHMATLSKVILAHAQKQERSVNNG